MIHNARFLRTLRTVLLHCTPSKIMKLHFQQEKN